MTDLESQSKFPDQGDECNRVSVGETISLSQGNGGRLTRELIDNVFVRLGNSRLLDTRHDAASLPLNSNVICMTTDSFTVQPLEFPGGDIGALSVNGTVNDLAVAGAKPLYISTAFIIEEGLPTEVLVRIVKSMWTAAMSANVDIVTGDTKVVPKGCGGGIYINTTGIGVDDGFPGMDASLIQPGDHVLVSGPIGDHGVAVMLARDEFGLSGDIVSDCASVLNLTRVLRGLDGVRFMRDPTRGGLATVMHELVEDTGLSISLDESSIPIRPEVESVCEMLGFDPYYLASEGRVVAVVDPNVSREVLKRWHQLPHGENAAVIGSIMSPNKGYNTVTLLTKLGGSRLLEPLEDDPLPRIC